MTEARFPTTHWTSIFAASDAESEPGQAALERLLCRYQAALYAHLVFKRRLPEDQAQDCLQSFIFERILGKAILQRADPARGRFRTFLLTSLDRFCTNQCRASHAQRRAPDGGFVSLEALPPQSNLRVPESVSDAFEITWASQVLRETLAQMQEQCRADRRSDIWEVFAARIVDPLLHQTKPEPYEVLVERYQWQSPDQASNLLNTGKRRFLRTLHSVIAEYAQSAQEIEEEIRELKRVLTDSSAWNALGRCRE